MLSATGFNITYLDPTKYLGPIPPDLILPNTMESPIALASQRSRALASQSLPFDSYQNKPCAAHTNPGIPVYPIDRAVEPPGYYRQTTATGFELTYLNPTKCLDHILPNTMEVPIALASQRSHALASQSLPSHQHQLCCAETNPGIPGYPIRGAVEAPGYYRQLTATGFKLTYLDPNRCLGPIPPAHILSNTMESPIALASQWSCELASESLPPNSYQNRSYGAETNPGIPRYPIGGTVASENLPSEFDQNRSFGAHTVPGLLEYPNDRALQARPLGNHTQLSDALRPSTSYPPNYSSVSESLPSDSYQQRSCGAHTIPHTIPRYPVDGALQARPLCNDIQLSGAVRPSTPPNDSVPEILSKYVNDSVTSTVNSNTHEFESAKQHVVEYYYGVKPSENQQELNPQHHTIPMLPGINAGHQSNFVPNVPSKPAPLPDNLTPTQRNLLSDWNKICRTTCQRLALEDCQPESEVLSDETNSTVLSRKCQHENDENVSLHAASTSCSSDPEGNGKQMKMCEGKVKSVSRKQRKAQRWREQRKLCRRMFLCQKKQGALTGCVQRSTFDKEEKRKEKRKRNKEMRTVYERKSTLCVIMGSTMTIKLEDIKEHFNQFGDVVMASEYKAAGRKRRYVQIRFKKVTWANSAFQHLQCDKIQVKHMIGHEQVVIHKFKESECVSAAQAQEMKSLPDLYQDWNQDMELVKRTLVVPLNESNKRDEIKEYFTKLGDLEGTTESIHWRGKAKAPLWIFANFHFKTVASANTAFQHGCVYSNQNEYWSKYTFGDESIVLRFARKQDNIKANRNHKDDQDDIETSNTNMSAITESSQTA